MRTFILCVLTMAILSGCQSNGGGSNLSASTGIVTSCTNTGIRSLYISKIDTASSSNAIAKLYRKLASPQFSDLVDTLAYISETGSNEPVIFETSSGKKVILNVTSLKVIKDGYIAISFDALVEVQVNDNGVDKIGYEGIAGNALVDMNSGKVYDLTGYDIQNTLVDQNSIYITKDSFKSLYKIAFSDPSNAIPLNNGDYTPAGHLYFIMNGKVVADDHTFDINGIMIPRPITSVLLTSDQSTMTDAGEPFSAAIELTTNRDAPPYIIDHAGNLWGYRFDNNGKYAKFQVSLDNDGNTVVSNYEEFTLNVPLNNWTQLFFINGSGNYADHLLIGDQSYYYVRKNADTGITFEAGTSTFGNDFPGWVGNCAAYYDGSIYWVSNSTIYSMNLSQNQLSTVYSSPNLVNPVTVTVDGSSEYLTLRISKGTLIFYQYITAVDIGTYALSIGSADPVLLSQNEADIDSIVELDF